MFGGCLGKLESTSLVTLLSESGVSSFGRQGFFDASILELDAGQTQISASVDLLYDFGGDPSVFGRVAAVHALSDIYAVLATPVSATVCLGVSAERVADGSAADVLKGIGAGLEVNGAALSGGHTVRSADMFAAISVLGADSAVQRPRLRTDENYVLLLSKPLGSGVYLAARRNDLLNSAGDDELSSLLCQSNSAAASSLRTLIAQEPESVGLVTDVSGFGLLMALFSSLEAGWHANITASSLPLMTQTRTLIETHGIVTSLGDHNMLLGGR